MRNFIVRFFIITIFYSFNLYAPIVETTRYACCSPYGQCDLRLFDGKHVCQEACGGHNQCLPRDAYVVRNPLSGHTAAQLSSQVSAYVSGTSGEGSSVAVGTV